MDKKENNVIKTISDTLNNFEFLGLILCIIGSILNYFVFIVNGGKMPVLSDKKIKSSFHSKADEKSRFLIFADWIKIKLKSKSASMKFFSGVSGIPLGKDIIVSPGDLFIFASRLITSFCFVIGIVVVIFTKK